MTRFADIQARHAKATPGPWEVREDAGEWDIGGASSTACTIDMGWGNRADAEFIAHCPDDVGWLLDRVTRLETALDAIEAEPEDPLKVQAIARAVLDTEQT